MSEALFNEYRRQQSKIQKIELPSLGEVEDLISELRGYNLEKEDINVINKKVSRLMTGHSVISITIKPFVKLYRLNICPEKPTNISRIKYPPSKLITDYQRANRPHHPLFYCSLGKEAPFFELNLKIGDRVVWSSWENTTDIVVNNIGFSSKSFQSLGAQRPFLNIGSHVNIEDKIQLTVADFLCDEFTKKINKSCSYLYKLSAAISEIFLSGDFFNALLYPSISMWAGADNLAIKPNYVDNHLVPKSVKYFIITDIKEKEFSVNTIDFTNSFSQTEDINWKGRPEQWVLREKGTKATAIYENGEWVFRNQNGEIIEPE
jgi:hypothetical protein